MVFKRTKNNREMRQYNKADVEELKEKTGGASSRARSAPDHCAGKLGRLITHSGARKKYGLTYADMDRLKPAEVKPNPHSPSTVRLGAQVHRH